MHLNETPFHTSYRTPYGVNSPVSDILVSPTMSEWNDLVKDLSNDYNQAIGFIVYKGRLYIFPYNKSHDEISRIAGMTGRAAKRLSTWDLNISVPHGTFERRRNYGTGGYTEWKIIKIQGPRAALTKIWLKPFLNQINNKGLKFVRDVKTYLKAQKSTLRNKFIGGKQSDSYQHLFAKGPVPVPRKKRVATAAVAKKPKKKLVVKKPVVGAKPKVKTTVTKNKVIQSFNVPPRKTHKTATSATKTLQKAFPKSKKVTKK